MSGFVAVFVGVVVQSPRDSWLRSGPLASWVWSVGNRFPWWTASVPVRVGVLAAWTALCAVALLSQAQRLLLRELLRDKSFLYNARSPSLWNRVWFVAVRALTRGKPMLLSFQSALPRMPVPPLKETVAKYLASARLLQDDAEFARTEEAARVFLATDGPTLQFYLQLKSWVAPNYVTDWWEKYVYLRGRSPIAINSNFYVLDQGREHPTTVPEARAAVLVHSIMGYRRRLEREDIPPIMAGDGVVPLCMWQFERMFSTARIPHREVRRRRRRQQPRVLS